MGPSVDDLRTSLKTEEWKVVFGSWINSLCGVSNQRLTDHLHMGSM